MKINTLGHGFDPGLGPKNNPGDRHIPEYLIDFNEYLFIFRFRVRPRAPGFVQRPSRGGTVQACR